MPDPRSAMKEFRFLEQKRAAGRLTLDEELRLAELRDLIGPDPARSARPGFDVNAAAQRLRDALGDRRSGSRPSAFSLPFDEEDADALLDAALPGGPEPTAAYPVGHGPWDPAAEPGPGSALDPQAYADAEPTWDPSAFAGPAAPAEPGAPFADAEPTWDPNAFAMPAAPAEPGAPFADAEPTWDPDAFASPAAPAEPGAPFADAEPTWDPNAFVEHAAPPADGRAPTDDADVVAGDPAWAPTPATDPAREPLVAPGPAAEPGGLHAGPLLLEDDLEPLDAWQASAPPAPAPRAPDVHRPALAELSLEDDPAAEPSAPPTPGDAAGLPPEGFEIPAAPQPAAPGAPALGEYDEASPSTGTVAALELDGPDLVAEPEPAPGSRPPSAEVPLGEYDELAPATLPRDVALAPDAGALEAPSAEAAPGFPALGEYDDTSGFDAPAGFAAAIAGARGLEPADPDDASPALARTGPLLDAPEAGADAAQEAAAPPGAALHDPEGDDALRLGFQLESGGSFEAMTDAAVPDWARPGFTEEAPTWPAAAAPGHGGAPHGPEAWTTADPLALLGEGAPDPSPVPAETPTPAAAWPATSPAEPEPIGAAPAPKAQADGAAETALAGTEPEPVAAAREAPGARDARDPAATPDPDEDEILDIEEAGAVLAPDPSAEQDALPVPLDVAEPPPDDSLAPVEATAPAPSPDPRRCFDPPAAPAIPGAVSAAEALPAIDLSSFSAQAPEDVPLDDLPMLEGALLEELPAEALVPLPEPLEDDPAPDHGADATLPAAAPPVLAVPEAAPAAPLARATQVSGSHRVVVHTAEGLTLRGLLEHPDLAAETLRLVPGDGRPPQELAATGLSAIFFMIPPGDPPPPPEGRRVHVTFRDGRRVAGFSPDYADGATGFFLHPAEPRTHTGRIWVYQSAVKQVVVG